MLDSREQTTWWEIHTVEGLHYSSYHLTGVRLRSKRRVPVADDASCDATFFKTCRSIPGRMLPHPTCPPRPPVAPDLQIRCFTVPCQRVPSGPGWFRYGAIRIRRHRRPLMRTARLSQRGRVIPCRIQSNDTKSNLLSHIPGVLELV
jgi:hypothetical protein